MASGTPGAAQVVEGLSGVQGIATGEQAVTSSQSSLGDVREQTASVANTVALFEPVSLVCNVGDGEVARSMVDPSIEIHETTIGDAWVRDSGPTFLTHPDGRLGATHWTFNGWGNGGFSDWSDEQHVGGFIACLLYTSDAADERSSVDLGGRRIIKQKTKEKKKKQGGRHESQRERIMSSG